MLSHGVLRREVYLRDEEELAGQVSFVAPASRLSAPNGGRARPSAQGQRREPASAAAAATGVGELELPCAECRVGEPESAPESGDRPERVTDTAVGSRPAEREEGRDSAS